MKVITNYKTTLSASMTSSQNTVPVTSMLTTDDHTITAADFDSVAYLVIEPGSANMEIVKVTGVSGSSFTGAVRGLAFYGGAETAVAGNQKAHQAGVEVIMTNSHYYYDKMMDLDSTETITGIKTFTAPNYPKMDDVSTPPVSDEEFATKKYVDDTAIAGAAKATETVYGIAKLSSAAADPTAPVVVNNEEVSAAGGTGAGENKIVKANASGYIDKDYIELGTDPGLEFVTNGLEAKIKAAGGLVKDANGLSVDVGTTDGKIVQMTTGDKLPAVDGSNLIGLYPSFGNLTKDSSSDTTTTIAHSLGRIPKLIRLKAVFPNYNMAADVISDGAFNGTAQYCVFSALNTNGNQVGGGSSSSHAIVLARTASSGGDRLSGAVTVDATNITITWSKTGTPAGTFNLFWEAN